MTQLKNSIINQIHIKIYEKRGNDYLISKRRSFLIIMKEIILPDGARNMAMNKMIQ